MSSPHVRKTRPGTAKEGREIAAARKAYVRARRSLATQIDPENIPDEVLSGRWDEINRVLDHRRRQLLRMANVVGVGLGMRHRKGVEVDEPCIVVFVDKKVERAELLASKTRPLPKALRAGRLTVPIDVVELSEVKRHNDLASTGLAASIEAATIGAIARDRITKVPVFITAMHVTSLPDYVHQPGTPRIDFTVPSRGDEAGAQVIGWLERGTTHGIDAAKVVIEDMATVASHRPPLTVKGWRPTANDVNVVVRMYGRTSHFQIGVVRFLNVSIPAYGLVKTLLVQIHTDYGDSGAAIIDSADLVLGFLYGLAPSSLGNLRVFCPASLVMNVLGCAM